MAAETERKLRFINMRLKKLDRGMTRTDLQRFKEELQERVDRLNKLVAESKRRWQEHQAWVNGDIPREVEPEPETTLEEGRPMRDPGEVMLDEVRRRCRRLRRELKKATRERWRAFLLTELERSKLHMMTLRRWIIPECRILARYPWGRDPLVWEYVKPFVAWDRYQEKISQRQTSSEVAQ